MQTFAILLNQTLPDNEYVRNFWKKTIKFIFPFFKWLGCSANQPRLFFLAPLDWQEPQPEGGLPQVPSSPRLHPSMRRGCQAAAVETWRSSGYPSGQKQSGSYYRWVLFLTKMAWVRPLAVKAQGSLFKISRFFIVSQNHSTTPVRFPYDTISNICVFLLLVLKFHLYIANSKYYCLRSFNTSSKYCCQIKLECLLFRWRRHVRALRVSRSPSPGGNSGRAVRPRSAAVDQPEEELQNDDFTILLSITNWCKENEKFEFSRFSYQWRLFYNT